MSSRCRWGLPIILRNALSPRYRGPPRDTGLDLEFAGGNRQIISPKCRKNYAEFESDFKGVDIKILDSLDSRGA